MDKSLMAHCNYAIEKIDHLIIIVDLNLGNMSVTNDIENVLSDLSMKFSLYNKIIVYRDSDGNYDQVFTYKCGEFDRFKAISSKRFVKDLFDVIKILRQQGYLTSIND